MIKFKNIIIDRLKDIVLIKEELQSKNLFGKSGGSKKGGFIRQEILQKYNLLEINRLNLQLKFLKELEGNQHLTIQQIYNTIVAIINFYDHSFISSNNLQETRSKDRILREIFIRFMTKYPIKKQKYLLQYLVNEKNQINNTNYINWINEWSKEIFHIIDYKLPSQPTNRNIFNPQPKMPLNENKVQKRINITNSEIKLYADNPQQKTTRGLALYSRKTKTQSAENNESRINYFSREHLYGFIKTELQQYYSIYDCMDVDLQYIQRINKHTKKVDYFSVNTLSCMVHYISRNCNVVANQRIARFRDIMEEKNIHKFKKYTKGDQKNYIKEEDSPRKSKQISNKRLFTMHSHFNGEKSSLKLHLMNNWLTKTTAHTPTTTHPPTALTNTQQPAIIKEMQLSSYKTPPNSDNFNFVRHSQRQRRTRRQMFRKLNYTTLIYKQKQGHSVSKQIKREIPSRSDCESFNYLPNRIDQTEINYSSKIFIMDYRNDLDSMRMERQKTRLKAKKYSLKFSRNETLKSSGLKCHIE